MATAVGTKRARASDYDAAEPSATTTAAAATAAAAATSAGRADGDPSSDEDDQAEANEDEDDVGANATARRLSQRRGARRADQAVMGQNCPYMDTVSRYMLDFDFEKLCSVSLSNHNVYACLVCGKYFQGRGPASYAYLHSVHVGHHVFANLRTLRVRVRDSRTRAWRPRSPRHMSGAVTRGHVHAQVYCLPDNYEVIDSSLDDIKSVVRPAFTPADIAQLDTVVKYAQDLSNKPYMPGTAAAHAAPAAGGGGGYAWCGDTPRHSGRRVARRCTRVGPLQVSSA